VRIDIDMKTHFTIDTTNNRIYTTVIGEISTDELIKHIDRVNSHPDFRKGMDTLADFSRAIASHTIDLKKIVGTKEYTKTIEEVRGDCKWAIYAYEDNMYAFVQMFSVLTKGMQIRVKVFRTKKEAEDWLNER
jgi:hypothetical protein